MTSSSLGVATATAALFAVAAAVYLNIPATSRLGSSFSVVDGVFKHETEGSEMESFFGKAPADPKFGLVLPSFKDLQEKVKAMRAKGDDVKVLYLLRHAEGYHNEAEKEINDHDTWWKDEGLKDKYIDADLNPAGVKQSEDLSSRLSTSAELGLRVDHLLTSPLRRAVRTAGIAFNLTEDRRSAALPHYSSLSSKKALAVELARETLGQLKCDSRLTATKLAETFPWVDYSGIKENDELWKPDHRETIEEKKSRVRQFLTWLWLNKSLEDSTFFVIATHSGWINAALKELKVLNPESKWKPANAQMMGLLVRKNKEEEST